ncbi:hypothetical protein [Streptacidiphilus fuscans]|uniref:Uncharacterized protein n=1 Tax=Streptacidiphilus fuscans TaxID=2789292 RepID=A0A931BBA1_9ACTN|nr:hypothetical protein [Streptacidiphilus fuscans]MBF9073513.1 hypothetical protein [Streptacidiphilus fuscans]
MPSLRNPVGPLPASIYWRRRLVVLAALAGAVVLVSVLAFGGGGGGKQASAGSVSTPVGSITPGPTSTGHGSNDGTAGGTNPSAPAGASSTPTPSPSGPPVVTLPGGDGSTGGSSSGSTSGGTGSTGSGGSGQAAPNLPGTMSLAVCNAADLDLSLNSNEQTYAASQLPLFRLDIANTAQSPCRIDLGQKSAVLTITADTGAQVWSSGDCPKDTSSQWYAVPAAADGPLQAAFGWGRTTSKPGCTPGTGGAAVPAGTYVVHIGINGVATQPWHSFKLAQFGS